MVPSVRAYACEAIAYLRTAMPRNGIAHQVTNPPLKFEDNFIHLFKLSLNVFYQHSVFQDVVSRKYKSKLQNKVAQRPRDTLQGSKSVQAPSSHAADEATGVSQPSNFRLAERMLRRPFCSHNITLQCSVPRAAGPESSQDELLKRSCPVGTRVETFSFSLRYVRRYFHCSLNFSPLPIALLYLYFPVHYQLY